MIKFRLMTQVAALSGFTPASLGTDLYDMWDAENAAKITLSGASVDAWATSVNSYSATQAVSASKPTYSATSFNNRPGITFDGSDDELTYAGVGNFPTGAVAGEIWALVDQAALAADATNRAVIRYGDTNTTSRNLTRSVVGTNIGIGAIGNGVASPTTPAPAVDFSGKHALRLEIGATTSTMWIDATSGVPLAVVPATSTVRTRIGAISSFTPSSFFQGVISLIVITKPLSASQAAQMWAYFKARGGIP